MKKPRISTLLITFIVFSYIGLGLHKYKLFSIKNQISPTELTNEKYQARCLRVIDGDTIEVAFVGKNKYSNNKEKIRFIGINTPELNKNKSEPAEYWAIEAANFTKNELENHYIELQFDNISQQKDKYGRLLCYIYIDNFLFNKILLESGNARYYPDFEFNHNMMKLFEDAENYAISNNMGMWQNE